MDRDLPRNAMSTIEASLRTFRVVVLTGARQAGKSTLVRKVARGRGGTILDLDDPTTLDAVTRDPLSVIGSARPPVVIDEFQRGGDALLRCVKSIVDRTPRPGRFLLTGSTRFLTVPTLSESLAGRADLVDLWPLSQGELRRTREGWIDRLFASVDAVRSIAVRPEGRIDVLTAVCRGGYPEIRAADAVQRRRWFDAYVRTVTERDVREISGVRRASDLVRLLRMLAARTAQEMNASDIGRDLKVARSTLDEHLALLETVHLWHRLPAWSTNLTAKVVRHPKAYLVDSGLAARLVGATPAALASAMHPALGPLVETFVVGEVARQQTWAETSCRLHHFRDRGGPEVDLVLEADDGRIAAIEVKASATVGSSDFKGLELLRDRLKDRFLHGVVLYLGEKILSFGDRLTAVPVPALWS